MCLFPIFLSSKPILDSNKQKEAKEANYTGEERERFLPLKENWQICTQENLAMHLLQQDMCPTIA